MEVIFCVKAIVYCHEKYGKSADIDDMKKSA